MKKEIRVELGDRTYPIYIGSGLLEQTGSLVNTCRSRCQVLLVSNPTVYELYGEKTKKSLRESGFKVVVSLMPDGEQYKNMDEAMKVIDVAVAARLERGDVIAALGGGVVGDLAGFVASVYHRGVDYVQIPTTLLSQVDSSIGGKVAVNHPGGKNLIGAFHQPRLVIIDPRTLDTLEEREYRAGLGEVVKYGIIYDRQFFQWLEQQVSAINAREVEAVTEMINRSCLIKKAIVEQDEKEQGLRAILNLGHTFGHAVEQLTDYKVYRHGEAVAMGIVAACHMAREYGLLSGEETDRIKKLFKKIQLLRGFPSLHEEYIFQTMLKDKKVQAQELQIIVPAGIGGHEFITAPSREQIFRAINSARMSE